MLSASTVRAIYMNLICPPISRDSPKTEHLTAFDMLPLIHRDLFDRLLIASAIAEQMTLITADENIARYEVAHIW